jgi:HAD superfamily hydrolase (TIGR01549 family)
MIRWVIFDAMGVIFRDGDDTNDLLVPFVRERNPDVSRETIDEVYRRASLGEITSRRLWEELGLGRDYPDVEDTYLCLLKLDPAFKSTASALAGDFRLGLLSNDVSEWSARLRSVNGLAFDAIAISGDLGCRKPSPEIYREFLEIAGATAAECVFVDDRPGNLAAAREAGFATVLFERQPATGDFVPDGRVTGFAQLEAAIEALAGRWNGAASVPS